MGFFDWFKTERVDVTSMGDRLNSIEESVREKTLKLEQAFKDLQVVVYALSHDLRSPLRTLKSIVAIIMEEHGGQLPPEVIQHLKAMQATTDRIESIVSDVMTYGSVASRNIEIVPVDVNEAVANACLITSNEARGRSNISIQKNMPKVQGNFNLLTFALSNLIDNAMKFTKPGTRAEVRVYVEPEGYSAKICVQDNGIGIDDRFREKIYEIFERLHSSQEYPGTGVGLAIVKKAVERMNGLTGFTSTLGAGSTFWIRLPVAA